MSDPLSFLLDIAHRVQSSEELGPALYALVEGLGRLQGWDVGEAWVLAGDGRTIQVGASWTREEALEPFVRDAASHGYVPGRGMVREVWESREPAWHEDLAALDRRDFLRWRAAERHGLRSGVLVPIVAGERTLAVLLFFVRATRPRDERALRLIRAAASQVAWLLERRVQSYAVERANERYRLVSENARDIISVHDAGGRYTWVSPSAREIMGYEPEELYGRHPRELLHPDEADDVLPHMADLLTGRAGLMGPYRMLAKHGREVWLESAARTVHDPLTGEVRQVVAASREVGERVRDRALLVASEASFRSLFAENPLPMWVYDTTTLAFLAVNEAAVRHYGYSREAFLDRTILDIRPREDHAGLLAMVRGERPTLKEAHSWRHQDAAGRVFEVEVSSHSTTFEGREARLVVARDVGEQKRAEREREQAMARAEAALAAAQASELRFRTLFEQSPIAKVVTSVPDGIILEANERLAELTGYSREELLGRKGADLDLSLDAEDRERLTTAMEERGRVRDLQGRFRRRDGALRETAVSASVLTLEGRTVVMANMLDLTNQRQLERERDRQAEQLRAQAAELERRVAERTTQLSAVNRELEGFTYSVSHDLRAPLRAIDGFSLALLEDRADALDERGRHYLERVRAATQRMGLLIDDLLALSRVGRTPLERREVDLAELARSILAELQEAEPERTVEVVVPPTLPAAADRSLMAVLLHNLLANAWKFTSKTDRARVELGAERLDGAMAYTVRDNGAGFDMRYAERLFAPFQRLHTVEEFPGTGVGLATVRRIVQRHGGRLWADGEVGRGAAFHFTLGEGTP